MIDTPIEYAALVLIGAAVLLLTPWVVRGLATANRYLVRGLLGSDVFARVQTLTDSRAAAVDLAAEDRRRIERDLHDGVQQRLVSLAMDLGRAKEKLDTDPGRAKELVDEAHEEAKRAITEVRDLARGIHPAVLTDRGLDAALSALAVRSSCRWRSAWTSPSGPASVGPPPTRRERGVANVGRTGATLEVTVRRSGDLTVQVQTTAWAGASSRVGPRRLRDRWARSTVAALLCRRAGEVLMVEIPCGS